MMFIGVKKLIVLFYRKDGRWNTIIKDLTSYIVEILPDESCAYDKPNPQNYDNLEGYSEDFLCIKRSSQEKKNFQIITLVKLLP